MLQSYGIVTPDNSSTMLIFSGYFSHLWIFQANGLVNAYFVLLFAIKKTHGSRNQLLGKHIHLNFSSLFRRLSWRTTILRWQAAHEPLGIS
ncbi:hypothetical protein [Hymenobacter sp. UYCo722]|uniref:hypothetical protein n=1 Tax=Hymenobacter sp. UYCo722 TaxID=3156335 RepID=UPI0033944FD4